MIESSDPSRELLWGNPSFAAVIDIQLRSPDFDNDGLIPIIHAAARAGGANLSPALTWARTSGARQLLLIVEDPDAPTRLPYQHCLALLDPALVGLDAGALNDPLGVGVQYARSAAGPGYLGPAPPKTHAPHRYVFQLYALESPVPVTGQAGTAAISRATLANETVKVLARGRLDGFFAQSPPRNTSKR